MLIRIQIILVVFVLSLAALTSYADVITASNFPFGQTYTGGWQEIAMDMSSYNGYTNSAWGQSFIANTSGLLTYVDTLLAAGPEHPIQGSPPLVVSFSESQAGFPTTILGAVSYTQSDFNPLLYSNYYLLTVDFTGFKIPIHAGNEYIVTYQSPFGVPTTDYNAPYYVGLVLDNPIPFGRVTTVALNGVDWQRSLPPTPPYTFELATRAWVTPEPPSSHILVFALAIPIFMRCCRPSHRRR